ncbi:MAG: branched-chain amino acid ABC transporter permease [Dehalococcoidia bacterium]|nr:branched-chain amino acid ABC transporter permease [Dehalococcoidia bacterium]
MDTFLNLLAGGISLSATYLLVTLGFAFIFYIGRVLDICFAGIYVWAGYTVWFLALELGVALWIAVIAAIALGGLLAWLTQVVVVWPMRNRGASSFVILVGTLGIMIVMEAIPLTIWGGESRLAREAAHSVTLGSVTMPDIKIIAIVAALLVFLSVRYFLGRTRTGIAMQAVGSNAEMAKVVGIDIKKICIIAVVMGCAIGSGGAVIVAMDTGISPMVGFEALLIAFVCAILGGFGSFSGAAIGALIIGMVRVMSGWVLPTLWQEFIVFLILFVLIAFRPRGIFGKKVWKAEV